MKRPQSESNRSIGRESHRRHTVLIGGTGIQEKAKVNSGVTKTENHWKDRHNSTSVIKPATHNAKDHMFLARNLNGKGDMISLMQ